jgi:SNF2 family DNA or RNA helicase
VRYEPREYQKIAIRYLLDNPRCMLIADPGLGKTSVVLSALDLLKMGGSSFLPALVIAPKRVADVVWTGERDLWDEFRHLSIIKIMGAEPERLNALRQPTADIYVCNFELVVWLVNQFPAEKWPFKIVIADEASRLKSFRLNKGGKRAAALSKIARYTGRWWSLTGTPCPNGLIDLWGLAWFSDFGERLKRSFTAYKEAFFIENQYTRKLTLQHGAEA